MVIPKPGQDICDKCCIMANQICRKQQESSGVLNLAGLFEDKADSVLLQGVKDADIKVLNPAAHADKRKKTKAMLKSESIVEAAGTHVYYAQIYRERFNQLKDAAYNTRDSPRDQKCITWCADYAQNTMVPSMTGKQPGACYYLAALNGLIFGIVDSAEEKTNLAAHKYMEIDSGKGGSNVVPMLWAELMRQCWREGETLSEANFCFDNCPSQKKNSHVLQMLPVLINLGIC